MFVGTAHRAHGGAPLRGEGTAGIALTMKQAMGILSPCGILVVSAGSTAITRLEKLVVAQDLAAIVTRRRRKGSSVLVMCPR